MLIRLAVLLFAAQALAQAPATQTVFVTGSVRDTQMIKKVLQPATKEPHACFQFTDYPQQATYTLYFRWDHRYTLFVNSANEATFKLYDSEKKLLWEAVGRARSAGLYHQGHPEKRIYPELFEALGCPRWAEATKQSK